MIFEFSEEQDLVRQQVDRLLQAQPSAHMLRTMLNGDLAAARPAWQAVCETGIPSTALPEHLGGNGLGYLDLCVIAEVLGANLTPVPVTSSRFLAMEALLLFERDPVCTEWIQSLAAGERIGVLVDCRRPLVGQIETQGQKASGTFNLPVDGLSADCMVAICADGKLLLIDLDQPGVTIYTAAPRAPSWPVQTVTLTGASFHPISTLPSIQRTPDRFLPQSAILVAFQQLGGAERCLAQAVEYGKERLAFGREIGSFQALKHMLADLYVLTELARSNCVYAAWALASDADELSLAGALAHVSASKAYLECAKSNLQIHGAMGFTWEADCHLHYRRSLWLAGCLGGRPAWKRVIAQQLRTEAQDQERAHAF